MKKLLVLFVVLNCTMCIAQKVIVDGIVYKIKGETAYASKMSDSKSEVAIIRSSISYNGQEYPVTSIRDYSFQCYEYLRKVSIPNSVKILGRNAFNSCPNLQEITVPDEPMRIDAAFRNCNGIIKVKCQNGSLPEYMLSLLPEKCIFMIKYKNGTLNQ